MVALVNNQRFLALYNHIPQNERASIERRINAEFQHRSTVPLPANYGHTYIQTITWPAFIQLTFDLQLYVQNALWAANQKAQVDQTPDCPNWGRSFVWTSLH